MVRRHIWYSPDLVDTWGVEFCKRCPWTRRQCNSTLASKPWTLYVRLSDGYKTERKVACSISGFAK